MEYQQDKAGYEGLSAQNKRDMLTFGDINFIDIKQLNDTAEAMRLNVKALIADYRALKSVFINDTSVVRRIYASHEMAFKRRQISELRAMYRTTQADSRTLTDEYLRRLKGHDTYPAIISVSKVA